jgi:N-acetylmuramic acid 6-phosphate etherase
MEFPDRGQLLTEQPHPLSHNLDQLTPLEFVVLCQQADREAVAAVEKIGSALAAAITLVATALDHGGRLFYVGAGTSGRLGVLDAAECPPTFCSDPHLVQGLLAGGAAALLRSSEGLEDRPDLGAALMEQHQVTQGDVVLGITAGGTTPFVHGALREARSRGARTIFLACVPPEQMPCTYDLELRPLVGPELLAGSTRLKAGTATKLVLNALSTGVMVRLGKVYGNRMVDVAVTNAKLRDRALRIVMDLTGLSRDRATDLLEAAHLRVKTALLMHWGNVDCSTAEALLATHRGNLRHAHQSLVPDRLE